MRVDENIDDYFGRLMTTPTKRGAAGEDMADLKIVEKIL